MLIISFTEVVFLEMISTGIADASQTNGQADPEFENVTQNRLSKSTAALNFTNDEEHLPSPDVLYCSNPFILQNNAQVFHFLLI